MSDSFSAGWADDSGLARSELSDRVRRVEKLRLFAELASSVAHDLNNLFNPLSLYLDLIERELAHGTTERVAAHVSALRKVSDRGGEHVRRLRELARPLQEREVVDVELAQVALDAHCVASARLHERQLLVSHQHRGRARVRAHREDLVVAAAHLLENAADAAPPGSSIWLETAEESGSAWLRIRDLGPGMSEEVRSRASEPLFTTKPNSAGLGLTLATWIARRYMGSLELDSAPTRGTSAQLTFPTVE